MLKEFVQGYKEADRVFDGSAVKPETPSGRAKAGSPPVAAAPEKHYRLFWLMYLAPDSPIVPASADLYSKYHSATVRIPSVLVSALMSDQAARSTVAGVFPEPLAPSEDLGYLVFHEEAAATAAVAKIARAVESSFAGGSELSGYLYAELELSECLGAADAPAMTVKTKVLLNPAFDCVPTKTDEIIEIAADLIF